MRLTGWEALLNQQVEQARPLPFAWGSHDCLTFAANCVQAMTGQDYLAGIRETYRTRSGAYRLIKQQGGTLSACIDRHLTPKPIKQAQRGDVVMVQGAVGICMGLHSLFITETDGLAAVPTLQCQSAWTV